MNVHYLRAGDTVDLKKFEPIEFAAYKEDLSGNEIYDEANENGRPEKKIFNGDDRRSRRAGLCSSGIQTLHRDSIAFKDLSLNLLFCTR